MLPQLHIRYHGYSLVSMFVTMAPTPAVQLPLLAGQSPWLTRFPGQLPWLQVGDYGYNSDTMVTGGLLWQTSQLPWLQVGCHGYNTCRLVTLLVMCERLGTCSRSNRDS